MYAVNKKFIYTQILMNISYTNARLLRNLFVSKRKVSTASTLLILLHFLYSFFFIFIKKNIIIIIFVSSYFFINGKRILIFVFQQGLCISQLDFGIK